MARSLRKCPDVSAWPTVLWVLPAVLFALCIIASETTLAQDATPTSITLHWTAPGDDGSAGTAAEYDIRYSVSPIDAGNWAAATQCTGEPSPQMAGAEESFTVNGLLPGTQYHFAIITGDEVPNWSALSNVLSKSTLAEETAPDAIADLNTGVVTSNSIALTWTAPGDDGDQGTASQYDIRYATSPIDAGNWDAAVQCTGEPSPSVAGSAESFTVTGLNSSTAYYFAVMTADEVPNWSALSNVANAATADEDTPPAIIADLSTSNITANSITVTWTAPGDDGSGGTASLYDIRYASWPITDANWSAATCLIDEPDPQAAGNVESVTITDLDGSTTYYIAIKTADEVPNWSGMSNVAEATTLDIIPPAAIMDLSAVTGEDNGELILEWTATGDDGDDGTASYYAIAYSRDSITVDNWETADLWVSPPAPVQAGQAQACTLTALQPGEEYFAIVRVVDDALNPSDLSNCACGVSGLNLVLDVDEDNNGALPTEFHLAQNYPNPFNPSTVIEYSVPTASHVTVSIYNALGRLVETLADESKSAGTYTVIWNGTDSNGRSAASGVYFYRVSADEFTESKKMLLLK